MGDLREERSRDVLHLRRKYEKSVKHSKRPEKIIRDVNEEHAG